MKKQKLKTQKIGVWIDHAEARLIEPGKSPDKFRIIHSGIEGRLRTPGETADGTRLGNYRSTNNESHKHYSQQDEIKRYYKKLSEELSPYDEILLFGPSTAKKELHNYLAKKKEFSKKRITAEAADYITENQMVEHVNDFF